MYKRTPEAVRAAKPELQAAFALLQRLWVKDYQHIWTALQVGTAMRARAALHPSVHATFTRLPSQLPQFGWSQDAQPLVEALAGQLRQRMLDLVQRAYASIGVPKLAALLGCSQEEAAAAAASRGWPVADGLADVQQPEQPAGSSEAAALRSLERLTEFVVHLGS